jgi:hypothetical protein
VRDPDVGATAANSMGQWSVSYLASACPSLKAGW